jgi:hypothetical protein
MSGRRARREPSLQLHAGLIVVLRLLGNVTPGLAMLTEGCEKSDPRGGMGRLLGREREVARWLRAGGRELVDGGMLRGRLGAWTEVSLDHCPLGADEGRPDRL